jgi:mycothiol synthase
VSANGGFDRRPIGPKDAKAWAELLSTIRVADQGWEFFSEQDLRESFSDPSYDFARGSMAIFDGSTMVGYGTLELRSGADPVHEMRQDGAVHPEYRERGLGGQLLDWLEMAAVPLHEERFPGRPLSLSGACMSDNAEAVALFAAHGYRPARWFHAMVRDLSSALPEVHEPAGVEIVGFTPERSHDALVVRNEAFHDHWGSTEITIEHWDYFMAQGAFRPAFSFLAYTDGEPVGVILSHEYESYAEATGIRDLFIALIGTRSTARNRGIASALLVRALTEARAAGFTTASLEVDADSLTGALRLYERAGFTVEHTSITQTKPLSEAH